MNSRCQSHKFKKKIKKPSHAFIHISRSTPLKSQKWAMLVSKIFFVTNFTTFEMLFIFILVYHWHYFIVYIYKLSTQWLWQKKKKNGDSRLTVKGNLSFSSFSSQFQILNFCYNPKFKLLRRIEEENWILLSFLKAFLTMRHVYNFVGILLYS